ncbi:hypothetical protein [Actinomadura flavalba]|uniref:hypothetical protein n=1 Tax=Actinomadura flavalba TaxID=1120938 RepID=UPI001F0A7698|nr:hypothetical protein [Actinomadura flavalba]
MRLTQSMAIGPAVWWASAGRAPSPRDALGRESLTCEEPVSGASVRGWQILVAGRGTRASAGYVESMHTIARGLLAGAAGTSALNIVSYLDMALRARAASGTPERSAGRLAKAAGIDLGGGDRAANRKEALGALLGYATGLGVAVCAAPVVRRDAPFAVRAGVLGAGAMAASDVPLTLLRLTDPRDWSRGDWLSDAAPHLAYGVTAAAAFALLR